jgi:methylmalonyl-CoA mutase cobalamin-binding subunit
MRDDVNMLNDCAGEAAVDEAVVVRLASRVVSMLAARTDVPRPPFHQDLKDLMVCATTAADPGAMVATLAEFRRQRISSAVIADNYIPVVARELGDAWVNDRLDFVEVSVGTSRLQELLRDIGDQWLADTARGRSLGTILMIVPQGEQHTLGPILATAQLRRRGVSVCLRLSPSRDELSDLVRSRRFDGVFVSASSPDKIGDCRSLVARIKAQGGFALPVIVGGAVVGEVQDLQRITGADWVTADIDTALRACGLMHDTRVPQRSA